MNPEREGIARVLQLTEKLLEGRLTAEDREQLEQEVLSDAGARRAYVERVHLHAALKEASFKEPASLSEVLHTDGPAEEGGASRLASGRSKWLRLWLPLTAGLALLLSGWIFGRWQGDHLPVHARLVEAKGARWEGNLLPTQPGAGFANGRLKLAAGLATIEFAQGARVTMEGPSELEIMDSQTCFLHRGTLTAHVPPEAVGFVVDTADARLVDHGTDFGISIGAEGTAQVRVFEGKVELHHHASGEQLELLTRQSARVESKKLSRSTRAEDETSAMRRKHVIPYGKGAVMISTAEGQGRAAYTWSPGTDLHFSDQLLMVKHCGRPDFRRKAWLGFDLSKLQARKVKQATMTLMFEATGWGYASLLPDVVFTVYGITDDSLDEWKAEDLTWDNAPANDLEGIGADLSKATKLGSFIMPAGVLEGAFSLENDEKLAAFLNQDGNRYATLMVVRETGEIGGGGVVHGFAGNEHPMLRPPTLYLSLEE